MTDVQPGPVVPAAPVTLLDIFARQVEMGATLAVIHEQLKAIPDHEQRIRVLELARGKLIGGAFAISITVSAAGTWLGVILTRR